MNQKHLELAKYMMAGACSTCIDLICFNTCLTSFHLSLTYALLVGFSIGVLCNFIICNTLIFVRTTPLLRAISTHYSANLSSLFMQNIGLTVAQYSFLYNHLIITRLMISSITFLFNFFLIKRFAFKSLNSNQIMNISETQNISD